MQFEKPGRRSDFDYPDMVAEAVTNALNDGKVAYQQVQQAVVGYVDGVDLIIICAQVHGQ